MKPMYSADINSDIVILEENISSSATSIKVNNVSLLPSAPNLATIGFDDFNPETILYEGIDTANNRLINVKRGFQGTAQSWEAGANIARVFTAYDHDTFKENIEKLNSNKINKSGDTITGNLLPAPGAKVNLGSPDRPFSSIYADDLYLSAHSLYINNKKVIEDVSDTIQISTDPNQSLNIVTTGVGNLSFLSEDEINLVADGGIEATVSGSKSTKHINFTNDSPGGNLTFYANGSGGQIQFSAKDAITFNGSSVKINGKNVWHEGNFNPASKSDTNHTHDNRYYTESEINNLLSNKSDINHTHSQYLTELPSTATFNSITSNYFYQRTNGEPRTNLGNPTVTEMALFDSQFDNKLWFYPPDMFTFEYTNDGTTWVVHNVSESNIKKLVSGYVNASISIPNSCKKYRIRIQNKNSCVYINALYAYISTNGNRTAVRIRKKREDGDWIQHTNSSTTVSCWPGHLYLPMERIAWSRDTTSGHYRYIEIEFEPVWNNENNISLQRLELWGGFPAGSRSIFSWDENKNVKFPADIYANGNTKVSLEGHTHDDRYYTESEIDSKLSNKADKNHTHSQYLTSSQVISTITSQNLGSGFSFKNESGSWYQRIRTEDVTDLSVHRFVFEERQGSGDYIELFGVDGYGNIYAKGKKVSIEGHTHDDIFPSGIITMWSGSISNIPKGWVLCDGQNGTPDLRDRFIVGAGKSYNVGDTGGANSVTLTVDNLPAHSHTMGSAGSHTHTGSTNSSGSHTHSYSKPSENQLSFGLNQGSLLKNEWLTATTGSAGGHSHSISINSAGSHTHTINNTGGGKAHENRPPYYALAYIMKL